MKSGVVLSTLLHGAVLTWGLWSLSAPEPLQMAPVESLPVDLVPIEEFSQSMIGAKDAPVTETPAPNLTETPETLPMPAENVGDNETHRLMLRLGHAHGTLLSVLNIAFAASLARLSLPAIARTLASRCLTAATLLVPGGFIEQLPALGNERP